MVNEYRSFTTETLTLLPWFLTGQSHTVVSVVFDDTHC
jgi:hypothetical protein